MSESHSHHHHHHDAFGNIRTAFFLNLAFVLIEIVGGLWTNSIAILSDAIHDLGDCLSIGCAMLLEKFSRKAPDDEYTYGYRRYSLVSALLTSLILVAGSVVVVYSSIMRMLNPEEVRSSVMILIALAGVGINGAAVIKTMHGHNLNERSISLHMLEDVMGWVVVLIGSIVIRFTGFVLLDPILSIVVAIYLLYHAVRNILDVFSVLLERVPHGFSMEAYRESLATIPGVIGCHHIHVWTMDGEHLLSTLHVEVADVGDALSLAQLKRDVQQVSVSMGISHMTVQVDTPCDACQEHACLMHEEHEHHHEHDHDYHDHHHEHHHEHGHTHEQE